jgi:hypothetical protein
MSSSNGTGPQDRGGLTSVALTGEQAYLVGVALVSILDTILNDRVNVMGSGVFQDAILLPTDSRDLRDAMNDLSRHVDALNAVGWPVDHYRPGFEYTDPNARARAVADASDSD